MHTEEEAKKKWCSMVNVSYAHPDKFHATNRQDIDGEDVFGARPCCIASKCMMWRWGYSPDQRDHDKKITAHVGECSGYCGLAGKPE